MVGLVVLIVVVLYLSLMVGAMSFAYGRAIRKGLPRRTAWKHAALGFLLVYLPVFWNHLPSWLLHTTLCHSMAGIQIYVDPNQWLDQHREVIDVLRIESLPERLESTKLPDDWSRRKINRAIVEDRRKSIIGLPGVFVEKRERRLLDIDSGQIIAAETTFANTRGAPGSADLRSWLFFRECTFVDPEHPGYATWAYITKKLILGVE